MSRYELVLTPEELAVLRVSVDETRGSLARVPAYNYDADLTRVMGELLERKQQYDVAERLLYKIAHAREVADHEPT